MNTPEEQFEVPPLTGVRVLDLSALLPGPMASLLLAEAGADVIKVERPGNGDEMRMYQPSFGQASANYALLNRGKRAFAADLKNPNQRDRILALMADADVVIEQFRPGVTDRLGLGYENASSVNPGLIYCSITGYGPEGAMASKAGHDLNYVAESGLLSVVTDGAGDPPLPFTVLADIAGGTYPAVMNIVLALRNRDLTGRGTHLQVSMAHNLQTMAYGYIATHRAGGGWPEPGRELLTGGSPRYHIYGTADDRHVAVAALEDRFWKRFTEIVGLDTALVNDTGQEEAVIEALGDILSKRTSEHWRGLLAAEDVCVSVVNTFDEAVQAGLVAVHSAFQVSHGDEEVSALPIPLDPSVRAAPGSRAYPQLSDLTSDAQWM